jgi:hypothetical protein
MKPLKQLTLVLSTGYILFYFSELLFWARLRPGDSLPGWLATWLTYSLAAFVFLTLLTYFRVSDIWGLFLAGAAFGWLTEGLLVQTAYEMLPLSLSFTGLAWHALISVGVGWYALLRSLVSPRRWASLLLSAAIGACYGLWAISWWLEPDGGTASVTEFAAFSFAATLPLLLACWLFNWSAEVAFHPPRWVIGGIAALFALYFFIVTIPAAPLSAVILPLLLALVYLGLRRQRRYSGRPPLLASLPVVIPAWKYLSLLAIPAVGTLVYALALSMNLHIPTNWILYLITTPLGFILFGYSLYRIWRGGSVPVETG